ncbi:hypothetical protein EDB19DRAFT_1912267 [Suillus lakei]|nr:hypothetical protein EDB19DRAFT_1912267 [Suillus lakei]
MPWPTTCPGNANQHPGQVVLDANHIACPQEVIAAKKKVSAEKLAKATALDNAQKQVATKEDVMAVEQMAQCTGPGHLVRPKPKPHPVTKAVTAPTANPNETLVGANPVSQGTDMKELSEVLKDISMAVYPHPGNFQYDDGCNLTFNIVSQRISEWRGNFSSTAITILMAFFASMDEYETKEAQKAYAEYQLEDSHFVYEDPDSEDSPGAFLLEFILHIFTVQLNATQG